jgi:uncharacterized membrane protein required for colicin V production
MTLSLYDAVMLGIVIVCVIQGAMKGMAWQLAPIASLVLGYLFGVPLSAATAPWFGEPPLNRVFSLITMYMLVSLGVYLIARSLRESIEKTKLVEFDRHLGALLGGIKGVLFTTVLTVGLVCVSPSAASIIVHSESRTIADNIIDYVSPLLPQDVHRVIDPYLKPIESLPDGKPHQVVEQDPPAIQDMAQQDETTFQPRTRRHNAIYEDTPADTDAESEYDSSPSARGTNQKPTRDDDEFSNEPSLRRRRRAANETPSGEFDTAEGDNPFGADPNQAFEDSRSPRRR